MTSHVRAILWLLPIIILGGESGIDAQERKPNPCISKYKGALHIESQTSVISPAKPFVLSLTIENTGEQKLPLNYAPDLYLTQRNTPEDRSETPEGYYGQLYSEQVAELFQKKYLVPAEKLTIRLEVSNAAWRGRSYFSAFSPRDWLFDTDPPPQGNYLLFAGLLFGGPKGPDCSTSAYSNGIKVGVDSASIKRADLAAYADLVRIGNDSEVIESGKPFSLALSVTNRTPYILYFAPHPNDIFRTGHLGPYLTLWQKESVVQMKDRDNADYKGFLRSEALARKRMLRPGETISFSVDITKAKWVSEQTRRWFTMSKVVRGGDYYLYVDVPMTIFAESRRFENVRSNGLKVTVK